MISINIIPDRNSAKFGLEFLDTDRRSKVYWELYSLELLECLSHGRPATFALVPADVAMPRRSDQRANCDTISYLLSFLKLNFTSA